MGRGEYLRFLLDNDVPNSVAKVLRTAGHDCVTANVVGLAGRVAASDRDVAIYAEDEKRILLSHDREFAAWQRRQTIGVHVRIDCQQPLASKVVAAHLPDLVAAIPSPYRAWFIRIGPSGILESQPGRWQ